MVTTLGSATGTSFTAATTGYSGVYTLSATYGELGCTSTPITTGTRTVSSQPSGTLTLSNSPAICYGATESLSVSMTGGSGTASYNWSGPGITGTASTGSTSVYTVVPVGSGAYTVTVGFSDAGCGIDTMVSATVTPTSQSWAGTTSGDWNTASNWTCGTVPTVTDSVVIPNGTPNAPVVASSAVGYANYMNINSGAVVTIGSSASLNVYGNLVNNGLTQGSGTLALVGTSTQTLSGNGTVTNMELDNAAGANINTSSDTVLVNGTLTLASGTLSTNNTLVLNMSDNFSLVTVNGQIGPIASGAGVSGNVIIQQYVEGGRRAYRFWGTPFSDSIALSQLETRMDITGAFGSVRGFTSTSSNAASAFWYHTTNSNSSVTGGAGDPGWKAFTWATDSMSGTTQVSADSNMVHRFEGFRLFFRGAKGEGLTGSTTYTIDPITVRQWGPVNQGTIDVKLQKGSLTSSTGAFLQDYNQKSNPYPSPVDIGSVVYNAYTTGQLAQSTVWVWNPYAATAGGFVSVDETTLNPYVIAANTSYQVRAANNGSALVFTEYNKASTPSIELLKETSDVISLNVYDMDNHFWDGLKVKFNAGAKDVEEGRGDAGKPVNPDMNFYSWSSDHHPLSIDSRPFEEGKVIPLGLTSNYNQQFVIRADNFSVPSGGVVYLHDKYLGKYTLLDQGVEYRFEVTKDAASQGDNRFELGLAPADAPVAGGQGSLKVLMVPNPASSGVTVTFNAPESAKTSVRILTVEGVCVATQDLGIQQNGSITLPLDNLASGVYMVEFTSGDKKVVQRLVKE